MVCVAPAPPEKTVKIDSVARIVGFRPSISLSFDQIMIIAGITSIQALKAHKMTPTRVCDQVSCHHPSHLAKAVQIIRNGDQRGADDGNFDVDKNHAQCKANPLQSVAALK